MRTRREFLREIGAAVPVAAITPTLVAAAASSSTAASAPARLALSPDWQAAPAPFRHTWAGLGNIDQFRWLVRADVRQHLARAREELGLRYVRACAMFSPEMRVWAPALADWRKPTEQRKAQANWQLIDNALEGLMELGLKPIYTTCFTPVGFTDRKETCWPDHNPIGMPRDLSQWSEFVAATVRHHINRYGRNEVRSWYFECWNEPNLSGFFAGTQEEYFRLWSATWRALKSADSELRFGGPSTARGEWLSDFIDWTRRDGTPPDYLISHIYNNDNAAAPLSPFDGPPSERLKDSPHFSAGVIRGVRRVLAEKGWNGELHWNEWGRSWHPHSSGHESILEPAFIAKTMAQVSQEADRFAFWCLSDVYDQVGYQASEFDGNYGMLSLHGLRKPAWHAHALLNRLGATRQPVIGGSDLMNGVASRTDDGLAVLAYAYPSSQDAAVSDVEVSVAVPAAACDLRLTRLGAAENNILARWRELGAPPYPTPEQVARLRASDGLQSAPASTLVRRDNMITFSMECPGVALLEARL